MILFDLQLSDATLVIRVGGQACYSSSTLNPSI